MMKKITTLVFTLIIGFSFGGCSNRESNNNVKEATTVAPATTTTVPETTTSATTTTTVETTEATTTTTAAETTIAVTTTTPATTRTDPFVDKRRKCLKVENIQQFPEYPTGCEAVSGSILLRYYGFEVDKSTLIDYQPTVKEPNEDGTWADPWKVFVGDPTTFRYGCYSPVIKQAIEDYWKDTGVEGYEVIDLSGAEFTDLYAEIDSGNPVIIWVSSFMQPINTEMESWKLEDGSTFKWTTFENCVVFTGYDTNEDTVIVSDPSDPYGEMEYPRIGVEQVYNQMYKQALVIHKK